MIQGNRGARALAPITLAAVLMLSGRARAQEADRHAGLTAQALYDQATAEMDAGNFANACGRLEEVTRLVPDALGAKMTLARCYEAWGKLATAWAQYTLVESVTAKAGQAERSARAGEKAAELRPKLATLAIDVPEAVRAYPGLAITRDGVPVGQGQWGLPLPVDTGEHELVVTAPGRKPWRGSAVVTADGEAVSAVIPVLERHAPDVAPEKPAPAPGAAAPPRAPAKPDAPHASGNVQRIAGLALGGAGLVGAGLGAFYGIRAMVKLSESNDSCTLEDECDRVGYGIRKEAQAAGDASTWLFIAGGAAILGGITLFLTAPGPRGPGAHVALGPRGITLEGRF
ncbi:tetratricopeptide repeat protein [Sorangium sp. So ce341]|uniref:tetratricopeptide repeat protein n=1 Tax=Sorangium sp. So ce341 TaxID=3133302 RepID=UPI003F63C347